MSKQPKEGWGCLRPGDRVVHYYRNMDSLCRRVGFYNGTVDPDDGNPVDGECKTCRKKLGELPESWIFSFGFSHVHEVDGVTFDKDGVIEIVGDVDSTRVKMFELFGNKWAMQYRREDAAMRHFPRGVVARYEAGNST